MGGDPVAEGLVTSLSRPGGNVTGVSFLNTLLEAKRLSILHEVVPASATLALLVSPALISTAKQTEDAVEGARILGRKLLVLNADNEREIEAAFARLAALHAGALAVCASPLFSRERKRIISLAARHSMPAIYESSEFVQAGGLMSYGASIADAYRQAGIYVGRILKGVRPDELPVLQSTRQELAINLRTAKSLGVTIPQSLLLRADDVIR
jgi:putative ABC transport system substrate-binding protein